MKNRLFFLACLPFCALFVAGCGEKSTDVWVKGKIVKGSTPYVPPEDLQVTLTFNAMELDGPDGSPIKSTEPFVADYNDEDGTFTVPGREGRGIPPGKYRISITLKMPREVFDVKKPQPKPGQKAVTRETDFFDDKFGPLRSPIIRDVKGPTELIIDLDKPTGI